MQYLPDVEKLINEELEKTDLPTICFLRIEDGKLKFFVNELKGTVSKETKEKILVIAMKHVRSRPKP